jgi:hypothetical protein
MTLSAVPRRIAQSGPHARRCRCIHHTGAQVEVVKSLTGTYEHLPIRAANTFRAETPLSAASTPVLGAANARPPFSTFPGVFLQTSRAPLGGRRSRQRTVQSLRPFSSSSQNMAAIKIDGTAIAKRIREDLHAEILERRKANPHYKPSLKIIQGVFHGI